MRHHAERADDNAESKSAQHNQHLRCTPLCAEEKMHRALVLVVQRESKEGKKNGCLKYPLKQAHEVFHQFPQCGADSKSGLAVVLKLGRAPIHRFTQGLAGFEVGHSFLGNGDTFAAARIAADTR